MSARCFSSSENAEFDLRKLIQDAYALGVYPDLWAVEGLGHLYALTFWNKERPIRGILTMSVRSVAREKPDDDACGHRIGICAATDEHRSLRTVRRKISGACFRSSLHW